MLRLVDSFPNLITLIPMSRFWNVSEHPHSRPFCAAFNIERDNLPSVQSLNSKKNKVPKLNSANVFFILILKGKYIL